MGELIYIIDIFTELVFFRRRHSEEVTFSEDDSDHSDDSVGDSDSCSDIHEPYMDEQPLPNQSLLYSDAETTPL